MEISNLIQTGELVKDEVADKLVKEAEAHAEEQIETIKEQKSKRKKALIKFGSMAVLAAVVVVFATIAWFSMNREVGSSGMGVKTAGMPFELAVTGDNVGAKSYVQTGTGRTATYDAGTEINSVSGAVNVEDGESGTYTYITNMSNGATSSGTFYTTGGGDDVIKWRLTSADNVRGLGPNDSGKLTFYIVPKQAGTLKIKLKIELEGYSADVVRNENDTFNASNLKKIESGDSGYDALKYLNSHILFFEDWTGDHDGEVSPYYYRSLIENGEFEVELSNCEVDKLVPVTIYWIWPNTYAQLTCIAASDNVANSSSGAASADTSTVTQLRNYMMDKRGDILKSNTDLINKMADSNEVDGETVYTFNASDAIDNVEELSMAYNLADQDIGTNIQYCLLTLTAE